VADQVKGEVMNPVALRLSVPQRVGLIVGLLLIIGSAVIATDLLSPRNRGAGVAAGTAPASGPATAGRVP
jgi:hypothetical protein